MANILYVDLLVDNGELIRIEYPAKFEDDLRDALDNARKRNDTWSPAMFDGCSAAYMGLSLTRINMNKIIGDL